MFQKELVVIEKELGLKCVVDRDFRAKDVIGYEIPDTREYLNKDEEFIDPDGIKRYRVKMPHENTHSFRKHISYLNGLGPYQISIERPSLSDCFNNFSPLEGKMFLGFSLFNGFFYQRKNDVIKHGFPRGIRILPFFGGAVMGFGFITLRSYCRLAGIIPLEPEKHDFWSDETPESLKMIPVERERKATFTTRTIRWILGGAL